MLFDLKHILIPLAGFLTIFGVIYLFISARYRERMAMIERGMDPRRPVNAATRQRMLLYSILALALAIGLGTANLLDSYTGFDVAYPVCLLTCGGVGLLIFYRITRSQPGNDTEPGDPAV